MKKNLFVIAAVALVAMVSCNKEEVNNGGVEPQKPSVVVEFVASVDTEATKTQLNAGKTEWLEGDAISINGVKFTTEDSGESVTFTNAEELPAEFAAPYTAVYPYSATEGTATVPAEQIVSNGTFADDVVVAVAYVESGNTLSFKHVSSVVKFQVATEGVEEIVFSSSTDLAGTINVNTDATYSVATSSQTITVTPASGTFSTEETYYVSVLPTIGNDKVDFAVTMDGTQAKAGNVMFERNHIMNAGELGIPRFIVKGNGVWENYNLHLWNNNNPTEWPGVAMKYCESKDFYYHDLNIADANTTINFVVNNGTCQTADSDAYISASGFTYSFPECKIFAAKPKTGFNHNDAFYNVYFYTVSQTGSPQFPTDGWRGKQMTYSHEDEDNYYYLITPVPNGQKIKYRIVGNGNAEINYDPEFTHTKYEGFTYYLNNDNVKTW